MGSIRGLAFGGGNLVNGLPEGLTLSRNATLPNVQIDIAPGRAVITQSPRSLAVLSSVLSKRLDATWTPGSGVGGRFSGEDPASPGQTWHVFLIRNTSTGDVDAGFSRQPNPNTQPFGWLVRMIGSILIDASGDIAAFSQNGSRFFATVLSFSTANLSTSTANTQSLNIPTSILVRAITIIDITGVNGQAVLIPGYGSISAVTNSTVKLLLPDLFPAINGQIGIYASSANVNVTIFTLGWEHPRGAL